MLARRRNRLSDGANAFLDHAAGYGRPFPFAVVATAAGLLDDDAALSVLDEVITAGLVVPDIGPERYEFGHALIRHAVYADLNPSRRARMHRRLADAARAAVGGPGGVEPAEVVPHYVASAALPGADAGIEPATTAADLAEESAAYDDAADLLTTARELAADDEERRLDLGCRLGRTLVWARRFDEAVATARGRRSPARRHPRARACRRLPRRRHGATRERRQRPARVAARPLGAAARAHPARRHMGDAHPARSGPSRGRGPGLPRDDPRRTGAAGGPPDPARLRPCGRARGPRAVRARGDVRQSPADPGGRRGRSVRPALPAGRRAGRAPALRIACASGARGRPAGAGGLLPQRGGPLLRRARTPRRGQGRHRRGRRPGPSHGRRRLGMAAHPRHRHGRRAGARHRPGLGGRAGPAHGCVPRIRGRQRRRPAPGGIGHRMRGQGRGPPAPRRRTPSS